MLVLTVGGSDGSSSTPAQAIADQLAWHNAPAEVEIGAGDGRLVADILQPAAERFCTDLLVMSGYGNGPLRETIFGGCTDPILKRVRLPVLMAH